VERFQSHLAFEKSPRPQSKDEQDVEEGKDEASAKHQAMIGPGISRVEIGDLTDQRPG